MEHSPTLKLIHTSEVQLGSRSPPSKSSLPDSQVQHEDAIAERGSEGPRSRSKLQEEEDQALFTDFSARKEYKKDIAELKEQICRRQIRYLQERLDSAKRSLTRHLEGVKMDKQGTRLELASNSQADRPLSVQQQHSGVREEKVASAALVAYNRDIALLNEKVHTREVKEFQMKLDSSKAALARAQKTPGKDAQTKSIPVTNQQTGRQTPEDEHDRETFIWRPTGNMCMMFCAAGLVLGLYVSELKHNDPEIMPRHPSGNGIKVAWFPELHDSTSISEPSTHTSHGIAGAGSTEITRPSEDKATQTTEDDLDVDAGADGRTHGDDVKPKFETALLGDGMRLTSDTAPLAIPSKEHKSPSSWKSCLWKK